MYAKTNQLKKKGKVISERKQNMIEMAMNNDEKPQQMI